MTPSHRQRRRGDDTERKAVLYCPDCGHASPIGGDWRVEPMADSGVVYRCSVCDAAITTRPKRDLALA